jgi:hypothetical protein
VLRLHPAHEALIPSTVSRFSTGAIINTTMDKAVVALITCQTSMARGSDFLRGAFPLWLCRVTWCRAWWVWGEMASRWGISTGDGL